MSSSDASRFTVKAWNLKRSANYGSQHVDEHALAVEKAELLDAKSVRLTVPQLHTTMSIEIACKLKDADGKDVERVIHGTIHEL